MFDLVKAIKRLRPRRAEYMYAAESGINPCFLLASDGCEELKEGSYRIFALRDDLEVATGVKNSGGAKGLKGVISEEERGLLDLTDRYGHPSLTRRVGEADHAVHFAGWAAQRKGYLQVLARSGRYDGAYFKKSFFDRALLELYTAIQFQSVYGKQAIRYYLPKGDPEAVLRFFLNDDQLSLGAHAEFCFYSESFVASLKTAFEGGADVKDFVLAAFFKKLLTYLLADRRVAFRKADRPHVKKLATDLTGDKFSKSKVAEAFEIISKFPLYFAALNAVFAKTPEVLADYCVNLQKHNLLRKIRSMKKAFADKDRSIVLTKLEKTILDIDFPESEEGARHLADFFALVYQMTRIKVSMTGEASYLCYQYRGLLNHYERGFQAIYPGITIAREISRDITRTGMFFSSLEDKASKIFAEILTHYEEVIAALAAKYTPEKVEIEIPLMLTARA